MSDAQYQWRREVSDSTWGFAKLSADLHSRKPSEETESTLQMITEELVSWWIEGFTQIDRGAVFTQEEVEAEIDAIAGEARK